MLSIDLIASLLLDKMYQYNKVGESGGLINYYLELEDSPELLIMGSSRAHRHVIPDSFNFNTFNLSHHGMLIPFQSGLINILEQKSKLPKILLVHIEMGSFCYYESQDISLKSLQNLKYYYSSNRQIKDYIDGISSTEKFKFVSRSYRYNGSIPSLIKNLYTTLYKFKPHDGFEPLLPTDLDSARISKQLKIQASLSYPSTELKMSHKALRFLNDIISISKRNHVKLIFFTSPRYTDSRTADIKADQYLSQLLKKEGIPFINYGTIKIPNLKSRTNWRDFEHMNLNGAKIFTSDFKKRLKEIDPEFNY